MSIRSKKRSIAATGASLALAAVLVGGGLTTASASAWAQTMTPGAEQVQQATPSPEPKPGRGGNERQRGGNMQQRGQMQEAYLNALAGRLGLSVDQLKAAMKQSRIDLINQAVAEGKLTQERADRMIQAIQTGQAPGQGQRGQGQGQGQRGPRQGQGPGQGQRGQNMPGPGQEIASFLGMTPEQVRAESQAGKSLAQIAESKGISRDALKSKVLELQKARLDAAVAAGKMTAEQAQQRAASLSANIDHLLDRTPGQRPQPRTPRTGG